MLALCLAAGARYAGPGEFTLRAFLNGRLDLAQAEAVLDVIDARTDASLRLAVSQLGGQLSRRVREVRRALLEARGYLEAHIDFPEDDLDDASGGDGDPVSSALAAAEAELAALLREAARGIIYRQGVRVAILGRPNVGKSSLLNRLLRHDRAIVTPVPGTTRDTLEETIDLEGVPVVLVDTAGIAASHDAVEQLGIERSRAAAERADLALIVVDGSVCPSAEDYQVARLVAGRSAIVVVNKSDLPSVDDYARLAVQAPHVAVSAATGDGLADLEAAMLYTIPRWRVAARRPRQRVALRREQPTASPGAGSRPQGGAFRPRGSGPGGGRRRAGGGGRPGSPRRTW